MALVRLLDRHSELSQSILLKMQGPPTRAGCEVRTGSPRPVMQAGSLRSAARGYGTACEVTDPELLPLFQSNRRGGVCCVGVP